MEINSKRFIIGFIIINITFLIVGIILMVIGNDLISRVPRYDLTVGIFARPIIIGTIFANSGFNLFLIPGIFGIIFGIMFLFKIFDIKESEILNGYVNLKIIKIYYDKIPYIIDFAIIISAIGGLLFGLGLYFSTGLAVLGAILLNFPGFYGLYLGILINILKYKKIEFTFSLGKKIKYLDEGKVILKRQFEYLSGFVRVKVKISNLTNFVITNAKFDLQIPKSFVFRKVEPDYPKEGDEIVIGNIAPQSEKTIAYTLEPLICGNEKLYGNLEFIDYKGTPEVMPMRPLNVEVICPLFFTDEDANIAKLNNLINYQLHKRDERCYCIPEKLSPQEAYNIVKEVIGRHHLKFISENINEEKSFEATAWYYGKTKIHKKDFVIQGIVSENCQSMKIFVACDNDTELTGFLSELGSDMRHKILRTGAVSSEDALRALRCPCCAAPLDRFPKANESMKCSYCDTPIFI